MKSLFVLFTLICCQSLLSQDSWTRLSPNPTQAAGLDVHFISNQMGFIITREELLRTSDGGTTWELLSGEVKGNRIDFRNDLGFVVGQAGRVFITEDAGENWTRLPNFSNRHLISVNIVGDNGVAVADEANVHLSADRGNSWQTFPVEGLRITDAFFTSPSVGHVVSMEGSIMKTSDSGHSWKITESTNADPSEYNRIVFVNNEVGYASREHAHVFKTIDGGESWTNLQITNSTNAAYDFHFLNESKGYYVGEHGMIYKTDNGGSSWESAGLAPIDGNDLYSVFFLDETRGFAAGLRGRILKTSDGGNSWEGYWPMYYEISNLNLTSESTMYVRMGNSILKGIDDGQTWNDLGRPIEGEKTLGIKFLSAELGYAIGGGKAGTSASSTKLFKTTDGGSSWSTDALPTDAISFEFLDENTGFVSGRYNTFRTTDGGVSWENVLEVGLAEFQFTDSEIGYAIDYYPHLVYKTTDGGNTWNQVFEAPNVPLSFHFFDALNGLVVGEQGLVYKTEDGGQSWEELDLPYDRYLDVKMYSLFTIYLIDEGGRLYRTLDGGDNWDLILTSFTNQRINIFEKEIYIYGKFGGIIKADALNERPVISGARTFITPEDSPFEVSLTDLTVIDSDNDFPNDFSLNILGGTNYSYDGNTITPATNFNGILEVRVNVSDGIMTSEDFFLSVEVTAVNDKPVITGTTGMLSTVVDTPLEISLSDLVVEDPDNEFPADFSMALLPGNNYTLVGNLVNPSAGFTGNLTVPVTVNDGMIDSDEFALLINVGRVTSLENEQFYQNLRVFPVPSTTNMLTVNFSSPSFNPVKLKLINTRGETLRTLTKTKEQYDFSHTLNRLNLSGGIYFLYITQDEHTEVVKVLTAR